MTCCVHKSWKNKCTAGSVFWVLSSALLLFCMISHTRMYEVSQRTYSRKLFLSNRPFCTYHASSLFQSLWIGSQHQSIDSTCTLQYCLLLSEASESNTECLNSFWLVNIMSRLGSTCASCHWNRIEITQIRRLPGQEIQPKLYCLHTEGVTHCPAFWCLLMVWYMVCHESFFVFM